MYFSKFSSFLCNTSFFNRTPWHKISVKTSQLSHPGLQRTLSPKRVRIPLCNPYLAAIKYWLRVKAAAKIITLFSPGCRLGFQFNHFAFSWPASAAPRMSLSMRIQINDVVIFVVACNLDAVVHKVIVWQQDNLLKHGYVWRISPSSRPLLRR